MIPLSLISTPYRLLAAIAFVAAFVVAVYAYAYHAGFKRAEDACSAEKLAAERQYQANYRMEVERGDILAKQLAERHTEIVYKTREVIKHVPIVTTGRPCLSSSAVSLLNDRTNPTSVPETTGNDATESSADAATDSDVAYWAAEAISQYESAAARLNTLIDYIEGMQ